MDPTKMKPEEMEKIIKKLHDGIIEDYSEVPDDIKDIIRDIIDTTVVRMGKIPMTLSNMKAIFWGYSMASGLAFGKAFEGEAEKTKIAALVASELLWRIRDAEGKMAKHIEDNFK